MKKTTVIGSLIVCGTLLAVANNTSYAAPGDGTTTGQIQFKEPGPGDKGTIVKPDTPDEEIEIDTGNHTVGPLRLTHVPDFDFDKVSLQSNTFTTKAKFEEYKKVGSTDPKAPIAHFVQVEDLRGKKANGWSLSVSASKFKPSKAGNSDLDKTAIILKEGKLFNTRLDSTELAAALNPFVKGEALTSTSKELLRTVSGKNTTSSKTSLVFNDNYTKANPVGGATDGFNPGVLIRVEDSDEKLVDETYTAVLTWTIENAI